MPRKVRAGSPLSSSAVFEPLEGRRLFAAAAVSADVSQLVFNDVVGGSVSPGRSVTIKNTGDATLTIPAGGVTIGGTAAGQFKTAAVTSPIKVAPGATVKLSVNFGATSLGPKGATLVVKTNAANAPTLSIPLRGLGTKGLQGANEPSLQWVLDTYQIPVNVGDNDAAEPTLPFPAVAGNDEVVGQMFRKAGTGDVTVTPIAIFSNPSDPGAIVGWYTSGATAGGSATVIAKAQLYTVPAADVQTLNPRTVGTTTFDPGAATFGLYSTWPAQANRTVYTEDFRNTFIAAANNQRMFTSFPLKNADGTIVPNAYVVGNEEAFNNDQQDAVFIVRNVVPLTSAAAAQPPATDGPAGGSTDTPTAGSTGGSAGDTTQAPGPIDVTPPDLTPPVVTPPVVVPPVVSPPVVSPPVVSPPVLSPPVVSPPVASPPVAPPPPVVVPPVVAVPTVYKASSTALVGAKLAKDNSGYAGTGYVDFANNAGDSATWTVTRSANGTATLTFRYANGSTADRPVELKVNGVVVSPKLTLAPTGSWTTWKTVSVIVSLISGANGVQLSTIGYNGPNMDTLTVL
ncbi:MAG: hypothetical protein JWO31_2175 [Phycisphaerales bacterium]|nr:hypothetical protein [Phycisphaerales bacterium]